MKLNRLYTAPDGRSAMADLDVPFITRRDLGRLTSEDLTVYFAREEAGYEQPLHPARRRLYVVHLAGTVEMETGDGVVHRFEPGDVCLAEDLAGPGHKSRVVGPGPSVRMLVDPESVRPPVQ